MPMFRLFSCVRSSNVYSSHSKRRHGYEQVEFRYDASVRVFKSRELIVATNKFSQGRVLGEGRLGRVYKGILKDGQEVAVKRFYEQADLWAEVRMLSCLVHSNLVKMIGYCDKVKDHIVVYEFMPLRSLNLHLQALKPGKKSLNWKKDEDSTGCFHGFRVFA
ncbi:probable serine/threonine-protein kinase PBL25 isoform X1 [Papaver somniferum]|uniref:probable serine/threonine-protein kinase PBL25 isoform X1 n=1 Tax=Papaver somniferum TaxID=3469 RepID=UPI000E6F7590|nr:probable serine/threonine-protein kinase PBL25 isoform X1 [Papaver somniferum]